MKDISERPVVRTTWAPKGRTPILASTGSWKSLSMSGVIITTPKGTRSKLFLMIFHGSMHGKDFVFYLKQLKRHLAGRKLLLIWDGLPAHRAGPVTEYVQTQQKWLKLARLPGYAPELNPIEYLWSAMKTKDISGLPVRGLPNLKQAIHRSRRRINGDQKVLTGFLRASGLY
ncbi:MAG: transposase [Candidatus Sungbacteria bacterium]|nr:transposase [Candidatus Sungbacteria bacterium]